MIDITIITPTFNSEKTIPRTLDSIVLQTYQCAELIIVDNLSNDKTLEVAKKYFEKNPERLNIISEKDSGISDAFSKGVNSAKSEIIGILNSDDEYFNEFVLERVAKAFEDKTIDFVHGDMIFNDDLHGSNKRRPLMCSLTYGMPINHPTLFIRKSLYAKIGAFRVDYKYAMDFELLCRMYRTPEDCAYKSIYIDSEPLVTMHAGGISWENELESIDEVEKALREHGFWSNQAFLNQLLRKTRIRIKNSLTAIGLGPVVKIWRNYKWK